MFSSQILIPSKPFFSPLNPSSITLVRIPLRLSALKPLANKKGKDFVNANSNQDALDAKGEILKDGNIPNSERQPPPNRNPNSDELIPFIKPRKKRRGRPSEAQYAEDYIRKQLEQTFSSIRSKVPDLFEEKAKILQDKIKDPNFDKDTIKDSNFNEDAMSSTDSSDEDVDKENENEKEKDEDPDWPVDAEVGWGIRASDYFEKHPIKNVVENGVEIDWEGEIDKGWVQEINCLEWESFAFHPSPLVVLVFERYKRPADNWKFLQELEKAAKVFWSSKNHLPPRTVKIDVNIERDLASALRVEEAENCPQLLFLKGNYILYREKEMRSSDEIVKMIAHFYYNAKKPEWINSTKVTSS